MQNTHTPLARILDFIPRIRDQQYRITRIPVLRAINLPAPKRHPTLARMIKHPDIRQLTLTPILPLNSLPRPDTLHTDQDPRARDAIMSAFKPGIERHEAREWLTLAVLEGNVAYAVGAAGRVDQDVVGGNATGEEAGIDAGGYEGAVAHFRTVGDEDGPDGEELAELEGIGVAREVELDLRWHCQHGDSGGR